MSDTENTDSKKASSTSSSKSSSDSPPTSHDQEATTEAEKVVQDKVDEAAEKGHYGERVDPTPLEHYTVAGVIAGKPTPETDPDAARDAREAARAGG